MTKVFHKHLKKLNCTTLQMITKKSHILLDTSLIGQITLASPENVCVNIFNTVT